MSKTRIIESVKRLDLETTRALLDAKPELLAVRSPKGHNLLHLACSASCERLKVPAKDAVNATATTIWRSAVIAEIIRYSIDENALVDYPE